MCEKFEAGCLSHVPQRGLFESEGISFPPLRRTQRKVRKKKLFSMRRCRRQKTQLIPMSEGWPARCVSESLWIHSWPITRIK